MIKVYASLVKKQVLSLEDVPSELRNAVLEII